MADYRIRVIVDPDQAVRGNKAVRAELDATAVAANRLRATLLQTFGAATFGVAVASGISLLADFEQEMSTVAAVSGATRDEFVALREEAVRLGSTTRFSATEAAQGMGELTKAGFTAAQALATTDDSLRLAQAGALGLGDAASITVGVLSGFRLAVDQAARVGDVLAKGANVATTDVSQLGNALSFVAPVSAGLGVTLEETTANLLALSNAGLEGSRSGTGLRRVLTELESPSEKTKEIFRSIGVEADSVRVSQVGLAQALQVLRDAGLDTGQALESFGDRGGPAFEIIANAIPTVRDFNSQLENAGGTAERIAAIMDDNLKGALLALRNSIQGVVLRFGELGASDALTGFVRSLATGFKTIADNMETVIGLLKVLAGALAAPALVAGIKILVNGFRSLALAIAANPLTVFAVAVGAAVAAVIVFGDQISVSQDGVTTLRDVAVAAFLLIEEAVYALLVTVGLIEPETSKAAKGVEDAGKKAAKGLEEPVGVAETLVNAAAAGLNAFVQFGAGIGAVASFAVDAIGSIFNAFTDVENIAKSLATAFKRLFVGDFQGAFDALADAGGNLAQDLTHDFEQFQQNITDIAKLDPGQDLLDRAREVGEERIASAKPERAPLPPPETPAKAAVPTEPTGSKVTDFSKTDQDLARQADILQVLIDKGTAAAEVARLQAEENLKLSETEKALLTNRVRTIEQLQLQADVLEEIQGPQRELEDRTAAINSLFKAGKIDAEEFAVAMGKINQATYELENSLGGGVNAAIQELINRSNDFGAQIQNTLVGAFDSATDAIIEFATTGKANFSELASSILRDLAKIALQKAIIGAISQAFGGAGGGFFGSLFGGGGGAAGGVTAPGGQRDGGQFTVGGGGGIDSQLVAFPASPGEEVTVRRPEQQQAAPAPMMVPAPKVDVIVVKDPNEIPLGIKSKGGREAMMAVIQENAATVKAALDTGG